MKDLRSQIGIHWSDYPMRKAAKAFHPNWVQGLGVVWIKSDRTIHGDEDREQEEDGDDGDLRESQSATPKRQLQRQGGTKSKQAKMSQKFRGKKKKKKVSETSFQ